MSRLKSQPPISIEELLSGAEQLETPELERFVRDVLTMRAKRIAPCLPDEEARLLEKINQGVGRKSQERFEELSAKRRSETLRPDECEELLLLTEEIERADAERVQSLSKLAWLRKVSLRVLMADLGLRPPDYV